MLPRERLICALNRGVPDLVPYFEYSISREVVRRAFGRCPDDPLEFNRLVGKADIEVWRKPPMFVRYEQTPDGRSHLAADEARRRRHPSAVDSAFRRKSHAHHGRSARAGDERPQSD